MREPRVWRYPELLKRRLRGRLLGWLALAAFVVLALVLIRFLYLPRSILVTISSGNTEGAGHQFLLGLARDASRGPLDIEPVTTDGTLDMLNRVDSGKLDFAFIQGGSEMDRYRNIRQVAALSVYGVSTADQGEYHALAGARTRRPDDQLGSGGYGDVLAEPGDPLIHRGSRTRIIGRWR